MPPMAGLQLIWPSVSMLWVSRSVRTPIRAAANAASLEHVEREHVLAILKQTGGVIEGPKGAARILNLHPNTLRSRMKKLGIEAKRLRHEMS